MQRDTESLSAWDTTPLPSEPQQGCLWPCSHCFSPQLLAPSHSEQEATGLPGHHRLQECWAGQADPPSRVLELPTRNQKPWASASCRLPSQECVLGEVGGGAVRMEKTQDPSQLAWFSRLSSVSWAPRLLIIITAAGISAELTMCQAQFSMLCAAPILCSGAMFISILPIGKLRAEQLNHLPHMTQLGSDPLA